MPADRVFADTNLLVYGVDDSEPEKQAIARHVLSRHWHQLVVSAQVLGEFHSVCAVKLSIPLDQVEADLLDYSRLRVMPTNSDDVIAGAALATRTGLSIFDSLVVGAASRAGCSLLLTEDAEILAAELDLKVENPFA